ncbi:MULTISPECIES: D-arabinono-1,4-lactone oxidase [Pseudonocardia]|uniref:L-gulono-1,4-lactone dehydrogenase n=2 Tax=Pseudonocardia TaxID=1847 RepID=A0A1Y2MM91_PSEAH|nr:MULTISPECIES: D-arabinono-1,4-lactone oxidase [Pseudonocardia]OSY36384.1 L-gulono-1,4-lactone dehydrogenase [Pseudonocardia autotrophica]TDN72660.1 L-gulonolactone oxidase [Pseudonocardia autotrophica]BBG03373.1 FAD-linked oxidoreductase [Pseudonocardia autotrophica]GEC27272.1 FAD-linked oxidoreductase [Pseudonocardia saturnea]
MNGTWRNWAGNQRTRPVRTVRAHDTGAVADAVRAAADEGLRVKAVGSGHSFTGVGVADGVAIAAPSDPSGIRLDGETAHVPAGVTLHALNRRLWELGRALPNLGDIEAQTVAGAISTGTHGTGAGYRGIAAQVEGVELVLADGTVRRPAGDELAAARIGLGALGVLTEVSLRTVPAFRLRATETVRPLPEVLDGLDALTAAHDHVEFYWFPHTDLAVLKVNDRTGDDTPGRGRAAAWIGDELLGNAGFGLACRAGELAPPLVPRLNGILARRMPAGGYTGRSYEVFCSPRRVRFLEMEYAVPRAALPEAFAGLRAAAARHGHGVTFPVEVRVLGADDVPLATAYGRDTAYLAVHVRAGRPHETYFGAVEPVLAALDGRPHWGKLHTMTAPTLRSRYPAYDDVVAVRDRLDPEGRFRNPYLDRVLGVPCASPT